MKLRILQLGLVICWLCVISTAAIAQTLYDLDKHIQQPEYTPVNVFDKPTVDSQGNLNLSYTMGQVESHGFSYPINFHYQSGIKALVPANWIGLGWSFNPGGITRIPAVGNPKSRYNMVRNGDPDYLGIDPFDPAGQSALPDLFEVVIPGKGSSQMMQILRPNYASSTIPGYTTCDFAPLDQNGWKIQYQSAIQTIAGKTTGIYSDDFILQSQKADFSKFLITTPDGMSYLFASPTLGFTSLREKSGVAYFNRNQIHVQTWRLVAIFGAEYTGDRWQVPQSTNAQPWMKLDYGPVLSAIHNQTGAFRQTQYLTSISSPVASATFSTTSRYEPMLPWWERSAGFNDTQKKLTSIAFSFKGSSSNKTITLAHDNSFSPTPPSNPDKGRLKLLSLNDSSTEGLDYSFSYYAPKDTIKWNGYDTDASSFTDLFADYYGFFNKSTQAVLYNTNGDAPSSQNESESWSLASVSYHTGLKDSIFYEARFLGASQKASYKKAAFSVIEDLNYDPMDRDSFNTGGTYLAGPRVAAIFRDSRYDAFSTQANQLFTYQYLFPTIGAAPITYLVELLGSNQLNIANYAREAVHYQEIRAFQHQSVGSYNPANPLPPTEKTTKYTYQAAAANNAVVDTDSFGNPPNQSTGVYFTQDLPSPIDWKLTGVFELSSDMANADEQSYEVAEFGASNADSMATSWGVQASGSITANFKLAKVKSSRGQLASTRKQLADQLEHYAYTYEPQTGLLRERHRLQSGVGKPYQVQRYTYGFEQYPALQTRNILSVVIRTDDGLASAAGLVSWKSAQVTTWALATDPADDPLAYWKPKAHFSWNSAATVSGSPVAFNAYSSHSTPAGWVKPSHYRYDKYTGRLAQEFFPNGSYVLFTYGLNGSRLTTAALYRSGLPTLSINMAYANSWHQLSQLTQVNGRITRYSYDSYGRLSQVRNHDNNLVTAYEYAVNQSALGIYAGLNKIQNEQYTYPTGGASTTRIQTAEYFDSLGRLRQRLASNPSEQNTLQLSQYNNISQLVKAYLPYQTGLASSLDFVDEAAAESAALSFYSSLYGVSIANVKPYEQLSYFDTVSDIVKTRANPTINLSTQVQLAYPTTSLQINGQPVRMERTTDQLGHSSLRYTNHFGQQVRTVAAEGTSQERTTTMAFDELGNLISATSPKGLVTTYSYDSRSLLRTKKLPDQSQSHQYRYNASGQLRLHQNPNQYGTPPGTHSYSYHKYDGFGRLTEKGIYTGSVAISAADPDNASFPSGGSASARQTYSYDGTNLYSGFSSANQAGKLTREGYYTADGWGYTYYEYDSRGRITRQAQVLPGLAAKIIAYSYDTLDRLTQLSYQVGQADDFYQKYAYDAMGRLQSAQSSLDGASWSTELQNLSFNQNGALTSQRLGSASNPTNDYSYHIEGWLAAMNDPDNLTGGRHFGFELAYQANGNVLSQRWRQSMNLRSSALQYNYAYNAVNFLTSAAFSGGGYSSSAYDVTELAYDLDGNFTRIRRNNQTGVGLRSHLNLSYSAGTNKISLMEDPNPIDFYNFGYDAAGNMNLASHLSLSGASYDERNLPVEFNYGASKRLDMGYDSGALRVYKADQLGNTTHFVRDLNGSVIASYYNGALRYHGLLGPDGSLFGQANGTSRYYFLKDHPSIDGQVSGSVRTTVDFNNTALGYDDYYPFGKIMPGRSSSSSTPDDDYKFTGHQRDAELDLDYMLARNYDPLIGRFMQVDPLAMDYPSMNPYGYVLNNPMGYTDPNGESPLKLIKMGFNVLKRSYKAYKKTGKVNFKQIAKDEALSIADNVSTLADGELNAEDAFAAIDLVTGFGSEAKKASKALGLTDEAIDAAKGVTQGSKLLGKTVQQTATRMGRDGKAVEIIFKDGSKIDINAARVKQWIPNTHPRAPAGTLQKVKFPNSLPGSKGYKRLPTQQELDILNGF